MQLPLSLTLQPELDFANFVVGQNALAVNELMHLYQKVSNENAQSAVNIVASQRLITLWGSSGTGKTHLLHALANVAESHNVGVFVLDCAQLSTMLSAAQVPVSELLMGLEFYDIVCVDNVDVLLDSASGQVALFDLINRVIEAEHALVIAGHASPQDPLITLPDLRSRLCWGQVFQLLPLDDDGIIEVCTRSVQQRGIRLQAHAVEYLLNHAPRDMHSLQALIAQLDELSLIEQRGITIPLIKQCLEQS
jgi:DnaA family protein